jgi:hypothetical protein
LSTTTAGAESCQSRFCLLRLRSQSFLQLFMPSFSTSEFDLIFKYEKGQRALQADLLLELGQPTASREGVLSDEDSTLEVFILEEEDDLMVEYRSIINLLRSATYPVGATVQDRRKLRRLSRPYTIRGGHLYYTGHDMIQRQVITYAETKTVIMQCHNGLCGGHFATDTTFWKILTAGYYWSILFKDTKAYCYSCKLCQTYSRRNLFHGELHPIYPTAAFEKWGVDFVGPLPKSSRRNEYLIVATDYMTKWAEALPVKRATQTVTSDFIFHHIVCRFGCPLEIVTNRGSHFVNGVVTNLFNKLSVKH